MSTSYTPSSNWTRRELKGRDLSPRPTRPLEPVSFSSDPATDRLTDRLTDDVRRSPREEVHPASDDFMDKPMVNAVEDGATVDGPDIFDAPMVTSVDESRATFDETPLISPAPRREPESSAVVPAAAISPSRGARVSRASWMMGAAAVAVVATAGVGWMVLSGGEAGDLPAAEPTQPLEIAAATPASETDEALINMPVSETALPTGAAPTPAPAVREAAPARVTRAAAPTSATTPTPAPAAAEAAMPTPTPAEAEPIVTTPEPTPTISSEPAAPLIATQPLTPQ